MDSTGKEKEKAGYKRFFHVIFKDNVFQSSHPPSPSRVERGKAMADKVASVERRPMMRFTNL